MNLNIFLILVVVLFLFLLKQSKNKILQKALGSFLIVGGLFIFNPIPFLDDLLIAPLFFLAMGWEFSIEGIKNFFIPYTILTGVAGLAIAWAGVYVSGFKINYLKNKIKGMFK